MTFSNDTPVTTASGDSRDALLTWLQQNPKTLGWDAIVVYNRGRANALLMQQYIKKLTAENYMTPIDGQITGPEGSKLNFFGIQLGLPVLSFENADIEHSKARVSQAITAGLAILKSEPVGGYKGIHSIMRPNGAAGPTLWMDVDLLDAPGEVSDAGVVQIDLKKMTDFNTDLFSDKVSIINAQEFFLERFQEKPELQVYTLGSLNKSADSTLTPKNFIIRTQAAPSATNRAAPNYGDGAVVLLVTLKGGTDGGAPTKNSDFKYLIPNDENGTKYSSAVLLSNRTLFGKLLLNHLISVLPGKTLTLRTPTDGDGNPGHVYLEYTQGAVTQPEYKFVSSGFFGDFIVTATCPLLTLNLEGALFKASNNTIDFMWTGKTLTNIIDYHNTRGEEEDFYSSDPLEFRVNLNVTSALHVDPENGLIEFEQVAINDNQIEIHTPVNHYYQNQFRFENDLRDVLKLNLFEFTNHITLPNIDTFLLRNLLFPDNNSMVLTDAHVPGDLAVFGNVDPSLTSFVITPDKAILNPGGSKTFTVEPAATVSWSVKGLPGDTLPVGTITDKGVYTAPTLAELQGHDAQQAIITASGTTARGLAASSSTLVSIVSQTVSLNPIFSVAGPSSTLQFTAGTVDDRPLKWTLKNPALGGKLEPTTGLSSTYTAPAQQPTGMFILDEIQVTDDQGNMGHADVLIINKILGGQVEVDLTDAANGKAQLRFMKEYDDGPRPIPSELLVWTLLSGTGSVDAKGMYTEPQEQLTGFAIVTCAYPREEYEGGPVSTSYGYTVLPLPLSQYPDMARAFQ
ncbi:hypothetical protein ALQ04_04529 [Pseudomonas cichorii]|uniref:Uncharacterized protein n=1 Tax=Pseudomonas cichorii TaxID=36746 RepID=A0A3M4M9Q1_PSECI|nr:hypothetical protein [Pseudomonas cichorii]RMQ50646.1 hypothetical protein ALQ04_04529 [Pseudomonas cichorii]